MSGFLKDNLVWSGDVFSLLESLALTFPEFFVLSELELLHHIYL